MQIAPEPWIAMLASRTLPTVPSRIFVDVVCLRKWGCSWCQSRWHFRNVGCRNLQWSANGRRKPRNLRRSANGKRKSNRGLQTSMIFGTAPLCWTQWRAELDLWCQTRTWTVFFEKLQKFLWWRRPIHEQPRVWLTAHSTEIEPGNIWERIGNWSRNNFNGELSALLKGEGRVSKSLAIHRLASSQQSQLVFIRSSPEVLWNFTSFTKFTDSCFASRICVNSLMSSRTGCRVCIRRRYPQRIMLFSLFASTFLVWIYFELYRELLNAAAYEHIHVHDLQQRTILLL